MKVTLTVEIDVEPEKELNAKEVANVTAMSSRIVRNRLNALVGRRLGGERKPVGWEVNVQKIEVSGTSRAR